MTENNLEIEHLKTELDRLKVENPRLKIEIEKLREELERLKLELKEVQESLQSLQAENNRLIIECQQVKVERETITVTKKEYIHVKSPITWSIHFSSNFYASPEIGATQIGCCSKYWIGKDTAPSFNEFIKDKRIELKHQQTEVTSATTYNIHREIGFVGAKNLPTVFGITGFWHHALSVQANVKDYFYFAIEGGLGKYKYGTINAKEAFTNGTGSGINALEEYSDFTKTVYSFAIETGIDPFKFKENKPFGINLSIGAGYPFLMRLGINPNYQINIGKSKLQIGADLKYYINWTDPNLTIKNWFGKKTYNEFNDPYWKLNFQAISQRLYYGLKLGIILPTK